MEIKEYLELIEKQVHWCNSKMFLNKNAVVRPSCILTSVERYCELSDLAFAYDGVLKEIGVHSSLQPTMCRESGFVYFMGIKLIAVDFMKGDSFDVLHSAVWNNITFRDTKDGVPMAVFLHMLAGGRVIVKDKFDYTLKESAIRSIQADGTVVLADTMIKEYKFEDLTLIPLIK